MLLQVRMAQFFVSLPLFSNPSPWALPEYVRAGRNRPRMSEAPLFIKGMGGTG